MLQPSVFSRYMPQTSNKTHYQIDARNQPDFSDTFCNIHANGDDGNDGESVMMYPSMSGTTSHTLLSVHH